MKKNSNYLSLLYFVLAYLCLFPSNTFAQTLTPGAKISNAIDLGDLTVGTTGRSEEFSELMDDNNIGDDYGLPYDDIFYTFTLSSPCQIAVSSCGGNGNGGFDTWSYLLDVNGAQLASVHCNNPECPWIQSCIYKTLPAGKYYVVSEGDVSLGDIYTNFNVFGTSIPQGATFFDPIDAGTFNCSSTNAFTDTKTNSGIYLVDYANGWLTPDISYTFTLTNAAQVTISTSGSTLASATAFLFYENGGLIAGNSTITVNLPAGKYYFLTQSNTATTGSITVKVSIQGGSSPSGANITNAIDAGTYDACRGGSYTNTQNNSTSNCYGNDYGQPSDDIYYSFTLNDPLEIQLSTAGSGFNTYLSVLDASGNLVTSNDNDGPLIQGTEASIKTTLPAGKYYIVSEGAGSASGNLITTLKVIKSINPAGSTMSNAIDIGALNPCGASYSDTKDLSLCYGDDYGQSPNDIFYTFTIDKQADISISHCGTSIYGSMLYLLDAGGNSNGSKYTDNTNRCSGLGILKLTLQPGRYYVVSEGSVLAGNGIITTNISTTASALPQISVTPQSVTISEDQSVVLTATGVAATYTWAPSNWLSATTGASVTASPLETTVYMVTGYSAYGCPSATVSSTITVTSPNNYNYLRETSVLVPNMTSEIAVDGLNVSGKSQATNYFDGLGRPMQTVIWQGSPNKKDFIQPRSYDEFGREPIKYLPYVDLHINGTYRANALNTTYTASDHFKFYTNGYGNAPDAADDQMNTGQYTYNTALAADKDIEVPGLVVLESGFSNNGHKLTVKLISSVDPSQSAILERINPYSVTVFEHSPLNRVLEQGTPGYDWQPTDQTGSSTGHTLKVTNTTNSDTDIPASWTDDYPPVPLWTIDNSTGALKTANYYAAGTLLVTTIKNENWKSTDGSANTKVEYKDFAGRVIMSTNYANATDAVSTYYVYDDMGRLRYTLPPLAMDQLTGTSYTQTDDVIKNLCFYYNYDQRGRVIEKHVPGADPVYLVYDNHDRLVLSQDGEQHTRKEWSFTKYDVLNRTIMTGTITYPTDKTRTELQTQASLSTVFAESPAASNIGYTVTNTFPVLDTSFEILNITYYDGYDFNNDGTDDYTYQNISGYTNQLFYRLTGNVTGTRTKILGTGTFQTTVVFYDKYDRSIQTLTDNILGGQDLGTSEFAFSGEVLKTNHQQTIVNGITQKLTTDERFTYDHARRLTATYHAINGGAEVNTSQLFYDELGQLVSKKLHVTDASYAQKIDYTYNIQGRLKAINNPNDLTTENDAFGMRLLYNDVTALTATGVKPDQQFTGNIAGIIWQGKGDPNPSAYAYSYDPLNRLKGGTLAIKSTGVWAASENFAEKGITYDKNGNIQTLVRNGNTGLAMDNLTFGYTGNQLMNLQDTGDKTTGFIDKTNTSAEYSYDANGNLIRDDNKGITAIDYNQLNLPQKISFGATQSVEYIYNASAQKLAKKITDGTAITWRYYVAGVEYDNNKNFAQLTFSEGRITKPSSTFTYEYAIKDHLGNIRAMVQSNGALLQAINYYPFGLQHIPVNPDNDNKYLYNGKELQSKEFGNGGLDWLDYGARLYDPQIGRWHVQEPLIDFTPNISPYVYAFNNPISIIDEFGMSPADATMIDPPGGYSQIRLVWDWIMNNVINPVSSFVTGGQFFWNQIHGWDYLANQTQCGVWSMEHGSWDTRPILAEIESLQFTFNQIPNNTEGKMFIPDIKPEKHYTPPPKPQPTKHRRRVENVADLGGMIIAGIGGDNNLADPLIRKRDIDITIGAIDNGIKQLGYSNVVNILKISCKANSSVNFNSILQTFLSRNYKVNVNVDGFKGPTVIPSGDLIITDLNVTYETWIDEYY